MAKGNFNRGFSLGSYNKNRQQKQQEEKKRQEAEDKLFQEAKEVIEKVIKFGSARIPCTEFNLIRAIKTLARGDSRFAWNYPPDMPNTFLIARKGDFSDKKIERK